MYYRSLYVAAGAIACAAIVNPAHAQKKQRLERVHYEYINAIQRGDIQKARDLAQLGNIDPNNMAGAPLVSSLFSNNGTWVPMSMPLLSNESFNYVFRELKQPFNAKLLPHGDQTVFSLMCLNFAQVKGFGTASADKVYNTIDRIKFAFAQGADPRPLPDIPDHMRDNQPFPSCVTAYLNYRTNPQVRGAILSVLNDYLEKGASPDYDQPVTLAAENYDTELFSLLAAHNVKFGRVFRVRNLPASCMRGGGLTSITKANTTDLDTLLGRLPRPKDTDVTVAREFLIAYIEAGGDITEKQHRFTSPGVRCEHQTETLFERAVGAGQISYAKMVQELEKLSRAEKQRELNKVLPFPTASPSSTPLGGSRVTTADINVREQPHLAGTLMSTLGANIEFVIEDSSPDGQWSRINAAPIVRGWANNAVIRKSSIPNTPDNGALATTASLGAPKTDAESLKQKMLFLVTGLERPPYRTVEEFHNAHGTHIKTQTHTYEPSFEGPCTVKLRYTSAAKKHTPSAGMDLDNFTSLRRFDFTRMTRISARYTEQPEEGMWWAFAGGPANPRLRKPRFVTLIDFFGADASCSLTNDGTPSNCSKAEQSNGNFPFPDPSKRPKHFQDAFSVVKAACTSVAQQ